jgi:uncharacterized membrane protein YjdF
VALQAASAEVMLVYVVEEIETPAQCFWVRVVKPVVLVGAAVDVAAAPWVFSQMQLLLLVLHVLGAPHRRKLPLSSHWES